MSSRLSSVIATIAGDSRSANDLSSVAGGLLQGRPRRGWLALIGDGHLRAVVQPRSRSHAR